MYPIQCNKSCHFINENKVLFFENGMCKFRNINGADVKIEILEEQLREIGIMEKEETINGSMEIISFHDTLGEMERVIESKLQVNREISINSVALYTARRIRARCCGDKVEVNTKYKTVDKKVKLVVAPLSEDSWQREICALETRNE